MCAGLDVDLGGDGDTAEGDETAGRHRTIVAWREPISGLVDRRRRQGYLFVGH